MAGVDKSSPYREALIGMINSINQVIPLREENQVLIVIKLNTEEKIHKWFEWLRPRIKGENDLQATEEEIVRAAVRIDKNIPVN
jgi:hypothetical protein